MIYFDEFPNLKPEDFEITSSPNEMYNCIAWAAGFNDVIWVPDEDQYWPPGAPREYSVEALIRAFEHIGFEKCDDGSHEAGTQKIAIYVSQGTYEHAARQLRNGQWTSKLGLEDDIRHSNVEAIAAGSYGQILQIMKRPYSNGTVLGDS